MSPFYYALSRDSGGVLWFHVGCPYVCLSVFLLAIVITCHLSKKGLLLKEIVCWQEKQILSFNGRSLFRREAKQFDKVASHERLSVPLKLFHCSYTKQYFVGTDQN